MNILVLADLMPYPPDSGGKIATYYPLKGLCAHHNLVLIALTEPDYPEEYLEHLRTEFCEVHPIYRRRPQMRAQLRNIAFSRVPLAISDSFYPEFCECVQKLIARWPIDLVHCEQHTTIYYYLSKLNLKQPKVAVVHNLEYERMLKMAQLVSGWKQRFYYWHDLRLIRSWEQQALSAFDAILCLSPLERDYIVENYQLAVPVEYTPRGVVLPPERAWEPPRAPQLLFVGAQNYLPNRDAASVLIEDYLPAIITKVPGCKLNIVGQVSPAERDRYLGRKEVLFVGHVANVSPYLERARVFVAPLRAGGGIKFKVLEAMAAGLPVVTSAVGAEGIAAEDGRDIFICNDDKSAIAIILKLLDDDQLCRKVGQNARKTILAMYSIEKSTQRIMQTYDRLLSR